MHELRTYLTLYIRYENLKLILYTQYIYTIYYLSYIFFTERGINGGFPQNYRRKCDGDGDLFAGIGTIYQKAQG